MTERTTLIQARVDEQDVRQIERDMASLGLQNRSDAIREGLRLLHRHARHANLARDYDDFYNGSEAPTSDITAIGDQIAADTMTSDQSAY